MWFSSNKRNFSSLTIACENARCDMLNQIHFNATRDMELQHGPCKLWWILAWKMHNFLCWCIAHLSYLYPCSVMSYGRESMIFPACRIWDIFNSVSWTDPLNWGSWIAQILLHEALRLAKISYLGIFLLSKGPNWRGKLCELFPTWHNGSGVFMGQRVDLPNHGDDSSVWRQLEQGHQEAGRGSAAANSSIQVDWGNRIGSKTWGSQQDQEG